MNDNYLQTWCPHCHYSLAFLESERCPECGLWHPQDNPIRGSWPICFRRDLHPWPLRTAQFLALTVFRPFHTLRRCDLAGLPLRPLLAWFLVCSLMFSGLRSLPSLPNVRAPGTAASYHLPLIKSLIVQSQLRFVLQAVAVLLACLVLAAPGRKNRSLRDSVVLALFCSHYAVAASAAALLLRYLPPYLQPLQGTGATLVWITYLIIVYAFWSRSLLRALLFSLVSLVVLVLSTSLFPRVVPIF